MAEGERGNNFTADASGNFKTYESAGEVNLKTIIAKKKRTEKSIMLECMTRLAYSGWRCLRVPPSIYGAKGWCDVIAIRKGIVCFIEFKSETGKLSIDQQRFRQMIEDAGGNYILCRKWEDIGDYLQTHTFF